jgi:glycosyltransferase involved in cell wall biosynthesis
VPGRIAFVPPRFGAGVVGGSEAVTREVALGLAGRGWDVEVITTCAVDHYSWDNDLAPGLTVEEGLAVHRFETRHTPGAPGRAAQDLIQEGKIPALDEQVSWVSWRFSVPGLFDHVVHHAERWDAVIFSPYLFWTTTVCLPEVADRAVAMPCLHDETYARLDVVKPVLASPARVWFLSEPEHDLAHRLGPVSPRHTVPGAGVDVPERYDPEGFRARHGLRRPFITFAGRREREKGWDWLLELFGEVCDRLPEQIDLVTMGVGEVTVPVRLRGRVHDLGFVDDHERDDAVAASLAYVQPSRMESFSRSVMEAWLAGTPVLAVEDGEVVAWHCRRSGGGLLFRDARTFAAALQALLELPSDAADLAERGRRYVLEHYRWPVVIDAMEEDLEGLRAERLG